MSPRAARKAVRSISDLHQIVELAIVRQRRVDRSAVADHNAIRLRARQKLGPVASPEEDEVGGSADDDLGRVVIVGYCRRITGNRASPRPRLVLRMIEMED